MSKQSRIIMLRQLVSEHRNLHVKMAAELLGVSEMTIRRDIRENSAEFDYLGGHIMATSGPAPYDLGHAVDLNKAGKKAACKHCLGLINAGDTIFIDCGTTLVHLVDLLPDDLPLTIICYSLNVADRAMRKTEVKMILMGGEYHKKTASFALLQNDQTYDALVINVAFLSAAGIDQLLGVTCSSFHEASQKRSAIQRAQKSILVVDESKFGKASAAKFADETSFDKIITENGPR